MREPEPAEHRAMYLDVVTRWADDLAHEIKNPFNSMVINLQLVKSRAGGDPSGVIERAEIVESELHRVHDLIDAVLRLVRPWPETADARPGDVLDALAPAIRARCRTRAIDCVFAPEDTGVAMPAAGLAWVLVLLADFAIDGTAEGGRLSAATRVDGDGVEILLEHTPVGEIEHRADSRLRAVAGRVEGAGGSLDVDRTDTAVRITVRLPGSGRT